MKLRRLILSFWLIAFVIILATVLFAFSYLNHKQYQRFALEKISDGFHFLNQDLKRVEKTIRDASLFLADDKKLLASVSMVDTYQEIDNYQHIIFYEEKKIVAERLQDFAQNMGLHFAALYNSTYDLISFYVTDTDNGSNYGYQSYNSGQPIIKAKTGSSDFLHNPRVEILLYNGFFGPESAKAQTLHYHDTPNGLIVEVVTPIVRKDLSGEEKSIGFARVFNRLDQSFLDNLSLRSGLGVALLTNLNDVISGSYTLTPQSSFEQLPELQSIEIDQNRMQDPGNNGIVYGARMPLENDEYAGIFFGMGQEFYQQGVTLLRNVIFTAIAGFFCILLPIGIIFIRHTITNPIDELLNAMAEFGKKEWQPLKERKRPIEFSMMADTFNQMADSILRSNDELRTLSTVVNQSPAAIAITDTEGNINYINPKMEQLTGYTLDEVIGKNPRVLQSGQTPPETYDQLWETISSGHVWKGEFVNRAKNGTLFWEYAVIAPIFGSDKTITKYVAIKEDITKRKHAEKLKKKLEAQLQQSQRLESIGMMAGGVAHDLNNILSGIIGYPELILDDLPQDSKLRKPIEAIEDSGRRAATVVADLLTVARGAASAKEECNINVLTQEYLASLECLKLKSLHSNVTYQHQFKAKHTTILASEVHVKKCLMNLVTNAAEAISGKGTVIVSICNKTVNQGTDDKHELQVGEYVVLSVQDTGSGIQDKDLEHIFEPFYTRKVMGRSGTGLGLTVVWNILKDHNGKVIVESGDRGTCFQLYFPVVAKKKKEPVSDKTTEDLGGNGEHILVVDDEPHLRDIASRMLEGLGYKIDSVSSGELAVKYVKENMVDLLVLDMLMEPGINGHQTYEEILKLNPDQQAIIVSGFSETEDVKATIKLGAHGFIKKPYTKGSLGRAVKAALNSENQHRESPVIRSTIK